MGKSNNLSEENLNNNTGETLLTIKEVAAIIQETPDVVRNWLKVLKDYIPVQKNEAGYNVFDNVALERMKLIRELHRDRNYSIKQINHYFATGGEAFKPGPKHSVDELLAEELRSIRNEIKELNDNYQQQKEFNKALINKLDEQQRYIDERLNKRDETLMQSLRQSLENQKQLAAAKEEENKKGFWNKLFGK